MSYLVCWSLDRLELVGDRGLGSVGVGYGRGYKKPKNGGKNGSENCVFGGAR